MRSNFQAPEGHPSYSRLLSMALATSLLVSLAGCELAINPFDDELAGRQEVTTPSVEGARKAEVTPIVLVREDQEAKTIAAKDGTVAHRPLYFEDPSDEQGSNDGRFAWTAEDYWYFLSWRARFLLNGIFFPVSFVDTPPWQVMESDGIPSRTICMGEVDSQPRE
jgi:hypothetical protein